jgi:hypothetical protein
MNFGLWPKSSISGRTDLPETLRLSSENWAGRFCIRDFAEKVVVQCT